MTATLAPATATWSVAGEFCDRCGAAGKLCVVLDGGSELIFCGHHGNRYANRLTAVAVALVVDPEFHWLRGGLRTPSSADDPQARTGCSV